jgi:hypothetical protein
LCRLWAFLSILNQYEHVMSLYHIGSRLLIMAGRFNEPDLPIGCCHLGIALRPEEGLKINFETNRVIH